MRNLIDRVMGLLERLGDEPDHIAFKLALHGFIGSRKVGRPSFAFTPLGLYLQTYLPRRLSLIGCTIFIGNRPNRPSFDLPSGAAAFQRNFLQGDYPWLEDEVLAQMNTPWGAAAWAVGLGHKGVMWVAVPPKAKGIMVAQAVAMLRLSRPAWAAAERMEADKQLAFSYREGAWCIVAHEMPETHPYLWRLLRNGVMRDNPAHYLRLLLNAGQREYLTFHNRSLLLPDDQVCAVLPRKRCDGLMLVRTAGQLNYLVTEASYSSAPQFPEAMFIGQLERLGEGQA